MTTEINATSKYEVTKAKGIKDWATGNWTYEFEFVQQDGKKARVLVPGDEADSASGLARRLTQKGARLPRNRDERGALLETVIASNPAQLVHQVAGTGWQVRRGGAPWMTVGARLIGAPPGQIEFAPPALVAKSRARALAESGTPDDWKAGVAAKAVYSTSLTVGIAAGFAAPLLAATGLPNFALHPHGLARSGKTTMMLCGMSVAGIGREKDLLNWNTSVARLLESAGAFGDLLFPVNEVGAAKGKRNNAYEKLRDFYAQYAEGWDRDRHSSWQAGQGAMTTAFRGICISTAEHSISEYAAKSGETRDPGELFRAIDFRAVREGQKTVLDLAPANVDHRAYLGQLRTALESCHGTAIGPYIEFLRSMGPTVVKREAWKLIEDFVKTVADGAQDGVARQIATNLGLLYAGGVFGIRAEILPWTLEHLMHALTLAFNDAIESSKVVDPLDMGLDILKSKLSTQVVERRDGVRFSDKDYAGYWSVSGGVRQYVVHTNQFGNWFSSKGLRDVVLNWLAAKGLLKRASETTSPVISLEDVKGLFPRWPDGRQVRSFVFLDPFPDQPNAASAPAVGASVDGGPGRRRGEQDDSEKNPFEEACGAFIDEDAIDDLAIATRPARSKTKRVSPIVARAERARRQAQREQARTGSAKPKSEAHGRQAKAKSMAKGTRAEKATKAKGSKLKHSD